MLNIIKQLSKELDVTKVNPRSNLEFDLMLDSLKQIELVSLVESRFNIAIPEEALTKVETLGEAVALVQDIQAASGKKDKKEVRTVRDRLAQGPGESGIKDNKSILFHIGPSFLNPLYKLFWNLRIEGKENLVQDRPVIFASNHESYLDIFWILCALPWPIRRKTYTIGKVELLRYPLLPFLLKRLNMIAVERDGDVLSALQAAHSVIKQGKNLALFPEGTRTRTGKMGEFKTGIGMLMDKTGVDVIPIRVKHSYGIWPPGRLPRLIGARAKVPIVTFGKPVSLNGLLDEGRVGTEKDTDQIAGTLKDIISSM
jgi:long-chain acyl-CoA synthetase